MAKAPLKAESAPLRGPGPVRYRMCWPAFFLNEAIGFFRAARGPAGLGQYRRLYPGAVG